MIRFDEVSIKREFSIEHNNYIKLPEFNYDYGEDGDCEIGNCIGLDGLFDYFKDGEMVELVDSCKNCKHNSSKSGAVFFRCEGIEPTTGDGLWISEDPETFWCAKGELEDEN